MNAECEIIGRMLVHSEEIDDVRLSVKAEMFEQKIYRDIFTKIMGGQTNPALLSESLIKEYPNINQVLAECVNFSLTLKQCVETLRKTHRAKETVKVLKQYDIDASNVDRVLFDLSDKIENLKPRLKSSGKSAEDLAQYMDCYFKPKGKRFHFGYYELDRLTGGVDKGDVCIIGARPSVGKSAFALNVLKNNKDIKGAYFNLEMSDQQVYERMVCNDSGIDLNHLRLAEHANNDEMVRLKESTERLKNEMKNVTFFNEVVSVNDIREKIKNKDFKYIIVDYIQIVVPDRRFDSRAGEVASISSGLKKLAMDFKIPVIALSQLNRKSEGGNDKEPSMAELRESGSLEQDASVIVMIWFHEDQNKRNFKVDKARMGIIGKTVLDFDGAHMKFSEPKGSIPFD